MIKIKGFFKNNLLLIALFTLYKLLLDFSYIKYIHPHFPVVFLFEMDWISYFLSWLYVLSGLFLIRLSMERASDFLVFFLFIVIVIPTFSYYGFAGRSSLYALFVFISFILIAGLNRVDFFNYQLAYLKNGPTAAIVVCFLCILLAYAFIYMHDGFRYLNWNFSTLYQNRLILSDKVFTGALAYLEFWAIEVFCPVLIAWGLYKKKIILFSFSLLMQILFFGLTNMKAVLFYPLVILLVYFSAKSRYFFQFMLLVFVGAVVFALLASALNIDIIPDLILRRALFVPAFLNFAYYSCFSKIGFVYMSSSILSPVIHYPFSHSTAFMVSYCVQRNYLTAMDGGFLATAYMHFGYVGMVLFAVFVFILFKCVDWIVQNKLPLGFALAVVITPFYSLFTGSDLTTALLTHGLGLALMLLYLFASNEKQE